MCSLKMMYQIGGGFRLLSRNKCLYSQLASRVSPGGYFTVNDRHAKRQYSAVLKCNTQTLQWKKLRNSSLLMSNCRSYHYNMFSNLTEAVGSMYLTVHDYSGLPWWAVILCCTVPLRFALSYTVYRYHTIMRYKGLYISRELLPVIKKREERLLNQHNKELTEKERENMLRSTLLHHQRRLNKEHGYNAYAGLMLHFMPLPYWIANSIALRKLSGAKLPFYFTEESAALSESMHYEGLFWFKDLCEFDPYHILPVAVGLLYFASIEITRLMDPNYGKKMQYTPYEATFVKFRQFIFACLSFWSIFSIIIFWNMPSGMVFFWFASGVFANCFRLIFVHPSIEKHIVPDKYHLEQDANPYGTILRNMKRRYNPSYWFLKF